MNERIRKYKVAYATGSRADYGIVRRYLNQLNEDPDIEFEVLVTGSHLEEKYGHTVDNILKDKFEIGIEVKLSIDNKKTSGILKSVSKAICEFGEFFETNKFDLLIVLGDRYEMMAVTFAAAMQGIPILHLHGGEVTYGNYDEFIRHSITKMSQYHFTSTEKYRQRVIQMGEYPDRVFNLGALGAENCLFIDETLVKSEIQALRDKNYCVIVFHPETLTDINLVEQVQQVLQAISNIDFFEYFVFVGTNADTNSDIIRDTWIQYTNSNNKAIYMENINVDSYLYMIKNAVVLIGNSSSGIIEAPSLGTYTINIGRRQEGRERANSVIDVKCEAEEIENRIRTVMKIHDDDKEILNPYFTPNTSQRYYDTTKEILQINNKGPKQFFDIDGGCFSTL